MKELGVNFGGFHTYKDWKLIWTDTDIGIPAPKTNTIDIPGADGVLDLTEALSGDVAYEDRTLTFYFSTTKEFSEKEWKDLLSEITNAIHGRRIDIILDDDPEWKYNGRCTIDLFTTNRTRSELTITCDCDPYKINVNDENEKSL